MKSDVVVAVERWMERAVVGMDLCPFAGPVWRGGAVRVVESDAETLDDAVACVLGEAVGLIEAPPEAVATTLVLVPDALDDFEAFLTAWGNVEALLEEAGCAALLQVAAFHPDWCFDAPDDPDAPAHYAGRAPCPIVHLLRADEVEEAAARHPDVASIPDVNRARLEAMGAEAVAALWAAFEEDEPG